MAKPTKPTTPPRKATPAGPTAKRRARPAEPTDAAPDVPASASAASASVVSLVSGTAPDQAEPDGADGTFRRPDLIGAVAARSALKRSEVKEVLDLVLDELGAALDARDMVILPPLGKIVIKARKGSGSASVLTAKIRRPAAQDGGASGLADKDAEG
ncbi:MAG: HU family DNA-binding protein [Rhodobacteraceae bacterium]|nr:HU family DNA-binding protein [Paracoccaceae bacterium]